MNEGRRDRLTEIPKRIMEKTMKPVEEMTVAELREYAEAKNIDLGELTLKGDIFLRIEEVDGKMPEPVVDDKPKIKVQEHLAVSGQRTADNHEGRLRDLEEAVAYLLAQ